MKLQIPDQALSKETTIVVRKLEKQSGQELVSLVFEFTPAGTNFDKPVYLSIKTAVETNELEGLALAWFNEETKLWIPIPAVYDTQTGTFTGVVNHFTSFAVIDKRKLQAAPVQPVKPIKLEDVKKAVRAAAAYVLADGERFRIGKLMD